MEIPLFGGLTDEENCGIIIGLVPHGEMAERLMALVLKTSDVERHRGFESLSLRQLFLSRDRWKASYADVPKWLKGLPC